MKLRNRSKNISSTKHFHSYSNDDDDDDNDDNDDDSVSESSEYDDDVMTGNEDSDTSKSEESHEQHNTKPSLKDMNILKFLYTMCDDDTDNKSESQSDVSENDSDWLPPSSKQRPSDTKKRKNRSKIVLIMNGNNDTGVERPHHDRRKKQKQDQDKTTRGKNRCKNKNKQNTMLPQPPIFPTNLEELIQLSLLCKDHKYKDCDRLDEMYGSLVELNKLVGLKTIKQSIFEFILMRLQKHGLILPNMNHIILAGPPGCGKTTLCQILGKLLCKLGVCKTENVVFGTQANMIAGFLGQTASMTEELIKSAFGGVLVIDEASSLADGRRSDNADSFSKSCLDTLNRMLSEHGDKFICILAGYKHEIYRDILSVNPGLPRRFSVQFEIDKYSPSDLRDITRIKIEQRGLQFKHDNDTLPPVDWFKKNLKYFLNFGGDCEILVDKIITYHSIQTFGKESKKIITRNDIEKGFELMIQHNCNDSKENDIDETALRLMYT
jgi:SpoVK/Ycf46/Vps4 family AAA+-type ATPase